MTTDHCHIVAIAEYGSVVRGDADRCSDRDLLLVGHDLYALRATKEKFERKGFSCACYSPLQLIALRTHGALFLQHLKQESRILYDPHHFIEQALVNFSPRPNYSHDIDANNELFRVASRVAKEPLLLSWALDVFAVAFRNMGILLLANEGRYCFGFSGVLKSLQELGRISNSQAATLTHLRERKAEYRGRGAKAGGQARLVAEVSKILRAAFRVDIEAGPATLSQFQERCLCDSESPDVRSWYSRVRLLEGAFLAHRVKYRTTAPESAIEAQISQLIRNPHCYTMSALPTSDALGDLVRDYLDRPPAA